MNKKLLRKKLALMLANVRKRRPYYCEVEYIENTETVATRNWISTGIVPDTTTKWEVRLSFNNTSTGKLMGSGYANPTRFNLGIETNKFRFAFNGWLDANQNIVTPDTNPHTWVMDATTKTFTIDEYPTTTAQNFVTSTYPICLFGRCNNASGVTEISNTVVGKIYYSKIWKNGVLVRDMIPVLDWDMTPCMYDKVSGELFYNKGTGSFTYGREIHYVDYLESTGTQYIDTGLSAVTYGVPSCDFKASFTKYSNIRYGILGYSNGASRAAGIVQVADDSLSLGNYNRDVYVAPINTSLEFHEVSVDKTNGTFTVDGNSVSASNTAWNVGNEQNILLFGTSTYNSSDVYKGAYKIAHFKIYNNDRTEILKDYIPAIDENGVGFMFDKINHTIYDNSGTGAFKYPAKEVEYLQSSDTQYIDTGFKVDDTCGYKVTYMALNSNDRIIIGTKGANDSRWALSGNNNPNTNLSWNTNYGRNGLGLNKVQTAQMNYLNDRKRFLNDVEITAITETLSSDAGTYNVCMFAGHWGSNTVSLYSTCRIYKAELTKASDIVRVFVPSYKDGVLGMLDKVNSVFYTNIGTGTFVTGKIVESEYE